MKIRIAITLVVLGLQDKKRLEISPFIIQESFKSVGRILMYLNLRNWRKIYNSRTPYINPQMSSKTDENRIKFKRPKGST